MSICPHCGEAYQHAHVCSGKVPLRLCLTHQIMYWGVSCHLCAREALNVLESRIADHDSELSALRRQVNELRQIVLDVQRAQNLTRP